MHCESVFVTYVLVATQIQTWPEIGGHFRFSNLLTFIELLSNHGSGTGVQGMASAANITYKAKKAILNL